MITDKIVLALLIIAILILITPILRIIEKNINKKMLIIQNQNNNFKLDNVIYHLDNISDNIEMAFIKLNDEEKMRFVNELCPKIKNYLDTQIIELKKIGRN